MPEREVHMDDMMPLLRERIDAGQRVRFAPRGISMLPMLRPGRDSVTLERAVEPLKKYDIPLYRRQDGSYVLHRVVRAGESYLCVGDNQIDCETVLPAQIVAVVTAFDRDGRARSVDAAGYRLYCRLWPLARFARRAWRSLRFRLGRRFA